MKSKRKVVLYVFSAIAILTFSFVIYKRIRSKSESIDKKPNFKEGNNVFRKNEIVVSVPVTKSDKYPLIYVFGGMYYANPDWMIKQIPQSVLSRSVVVLAPYTTKFDSINVKDIFNSNNINVDSNKISITGFSAGGLNVQEKYNDKYKIVGLIDPSTRKDYLKLPFSKNTKLIYNSKNWSKYPEIKNVLEKLELDIIKKGGESESTKINHEDIPKYFFEKYKKDLV